MRHPVFHFLLFSCHFLLIFSIFQIKQHIFCFLSFYLILLSLFCFFMVLTFFLSYICFPPPLPLPGFLFSFLRTILRFSHLSTLFIPSLCFLPLTAIFHRLLPFRCFSHLFFRFFTHTLLHLPLFNRFLPFLRLFLSFLLFFASSVVLHPTFCHFSAFLHFFASTYVTLPGSFFMFHAPQNVSRETSFFTIFGLQRSVRGDLLFLFPKITLIFGLFDF